jgi:hypothetical protein
MADFSFPPWHVGHVVYKLMIANEGDEMTRGDLAERADLRPMTITHMLRTGRSEDDTIEAVARVFGCTALELKQEVQRANQGAVAAVPAGEQRRRASDRPQEDVDAEQFARRMMRLSESAQNAIFMTIRAFEGMMRRIDDEPER